MTTDDRRDEFEYHLRELRADLASALAAASAADVSHLPDRQVVRAWVTLEAALRHDLQAHIPAALGILGARLGPATPSHATSVRGVEGLQRAARAVKALVEQADAALAQEIAGAESLTLVAELVRDALTIAGRGRTRAVRLARLDDTEISPS